MNAEISKRKKYWLDFQDLSSPVNRLLMIESSAYMPTLPLLWWEKKEERTWNIDMDRVRSAIPAEIPDEEMEAYTEKALEYYQQLLQKRKARDAR